MKVLSLGYEIEVTIKKSSAEAHYSVASYIEALEKGLVEKAQQEIAYIKLSNLYLQLERENIDMSKYHKQALYRYLAVAYPLCSTANFTDSFKATMQNEIRRHWESEFQKLPNWQLY